jgi:tripartite-type tricarboxylate transporter receptor subunit TctC
MPRTAVTPALLALLLALVASPANADWPDRPVRIISPVSAGGASDTLARIIAEHLGKIFGERFYVENRVGAGGLIGTNVVAHAPPDGYSFVTSSVAYTVIAPAASANPGFDTMRDFSHVVYIGGPPNVFVVTPSSGVRTIEQLRELARRTGPIAYSSPGVGSVGHLTVVRFAEKSGIPMQHIPNKGGSTALVDVLANNVALGTLTWSSALGAIRAGQVIPIAVSAAARLPEYPDVPTLKELGYEDLVATTWFGLSGPAGLPQEIVQKLNREVLKILDYPDVRERLTRDAIETRAMTPEEYTRFMASEVDKWTPLAKELNKSQ